MLIVDVDIPPTFSKAICEELVTLWDREYLPLPIGHFSISVESTSDISHTDQLTVIIRNVNMTTYEPVERFFFYFPPNF